MKKLVGTAVLAGMVLTAGAVFTASKLRNVAPLD